MYIPPRILAGDLTSDLVTKYNALTDALTDGTFSIRTSLIDATTAQDIILLAAQPNQYLHLTRVLLIVWVQEPDALPTLPQLSLGTNNLVNNMVANTTPANTLRLVQQLMPTAQAIDLRTLPLRLKVVPSNYTAFMVQVWIEGRLIGNGTD